MANRAVGGPVYRRNVHPVDEPMEQLEEILETYFPVAVAVTGAAILAAIGLIFWYAPVDRTMGVVQKIFYAHVPAAMAAYAGFTVTSVASFFYLIRPHRNWDFAAVSGAHVGLLFCAYVLVSGPLWASRVWGTAWVWDPQLTATLVLFLLYGAYALLRGLSDSNETTRKISAVLAVVAFVDIPIIHYSVRQWEGMHPVVEREGGGGLAPAMETAFSVSMVAFLLVFVLLLWLSVRVRRLAWRVEQLHIDLLEAEYAADRREASDEV